MADPDLGLTDRDKELKQWNKPYRYQEFPKALYRAATTTAGKMEITTREVTSEGEERLAVGAGWLRNPRLALEGETAEQEALGTEAAHRAWDDRRLSPAAQAEAAAVDAATAKHLPEIPATPKRSHRKKPEP